MKEKKPIEKEKRHIICILFPYTCVLNVSYKISHVTSFTERRKINIIVKKLHKKNRKILIYLYELQSPNVEFHSIYFPSVNGDTLARIFCND